MRFRVHCYSSRLLRRYIKVLLIIVIALGCSYLVLENIYFGELECAWFRIPGFENSNLMPDLKVERSRYDDRRMLRIYDFHYTGNDWGGLVRRYDVCFSTQTSIERIYWLPYVLEKWTGPLSLAVHLTSEEEWLVLNLYMGYLAKCHARYVNQVSMHIALPINVTSSFSVCDNIPNQWNSTNFNEIRTKRDSCPESKEYLNYLLAKFPTVDSWKLKFKEIYPQNHMRNIVRKACRGWTYSVDIDIIPNNGMADALQQFYESRKHVPCHKCHEKKCRRVTCVGGGVENEECAYVIPTFEMNETFSFPESKKALVKLYKKGAARKFHGNYFIPAHKATNYAKWVKTNLQEGPVKISHQIQLNDTSKYEPFYLSDDGIPPFDERFLGYGFTRSSQFQAAFVAGWKFSVLTPVFSIHWGLQTATTVLSPKKDGVGEDVRGHQIYVNQKIYNKILEELQLKKKLKSF